MSKSNVAGLLRGMDLCTASVLRCHLIGTITSIAMIACITWVWSCRNVTTTSIPHGDIMIDLSDATSLIANADSWRQRYAEQYKESLAVKQAAQAIRERLPAAVDWKAAESAIRASAQTNQLTVVSLKAGDRHVGARVGVLAADCQLRGSFLALCRFLAALPQSEIPIVCNAITLQRDQHSDHGQPICSATISLRLPYAASGTAAAELLAMEPQDAH